MKAKPQIPYRYYRNIQLFGALSRLLEGSNLAETLGAEQRHPEFQSFARPSCSAPPPAAGLNQANSSSPEESIPAGTFGVALFLAAAPLPEQQLASNPTIPFGVVRLVESRRQQTPRRRR